MPASQARKCLDAFDATLQSVAVFEGGKVFDIVDVEDLFAHASTVAYPAAGVVYGGIRSYAEGSPQNSSHKTGMSSELSVAVMLAVENTYPQDNDLYDAVDILDIIRKKFMDTKSPSGHNWRFVLEAPAVSKGNITIWVQRWSTPIVLTPTN